VPTEISVGEYRSLVRLATLLLHDASAAEDVVQEAFVAMHAGRRRPRDAGKALSYLRRAVVSRSRSVLRHRTVAGGTVSAYTPDGPSAEPGAMTLLGHSAILAALRSLPGRQREAIVLRYYVGLPEAEIAASMGISKRSVRHYTARGMATLKPVLEQDVP
jgi:RNA polymerase sigma-70 factor (sigma-E family)